MAATSSSIRDDACTWVSTARCGMPRSCRACLHDNNECAINALGACVSQQQQRVAGAASDPPSALLFAAHNTSYCPADDAACDRCAQQWRTDASRGMAVALTASCVGANGCVCLVACELSDWTARVLEAAQCNASSAAPTTTLHSAESSTSSTGQLLIAGAICFAAVLVFALISLGLGKLVRKMDRSALVTRRERLLNAFRLPRRAPTGPQLQLEGWTSMREKLVQSDAAGASAPTLAPPIALTPEYVQRSGGAQQDEHELWIRW